MNINNHNERGGEMEKELNELMGQLLKERDELEKNDATATELGINQGWIQSVQWYKEIFLNK